LKKNPTIRQYGRTKNNSRKVQARSKIRFDGSHELRFSHSQMPLQKDADLKKIKLLVNFLIVNQKKKKYFAKDILLEKLLDM
jgi:hypothetical protein